MWTPPRFAPVSLVSPKLVECPSVHVCEATTKPIYSGHLWAANMICVSCLLFSNLKPAWALKQSKLSVLIMAMTSWRGQ